MRPLYAIGKLTVGSAMRYGYLPRVEGLEHVPRRTGAILAANHLSVADELFLGAVVSRQVHYWAKEDYFHQTGVMGRLMAGLMYGLGTIPVHRDGGRAALEALDAAVPVLRGGGLVGLFPEGTRSPDGQLHRGRTGVAHLALAAGVPIVPIGIIGTGKILPNGHTIPRIGALGRSGVIIRFGAPMDVSDREHTMSAKRAITDELMIEIQKLSGQEYSERFARRTVGPAGEAD